MWTRWFLTKEHVQEWIGSIFQAKDFLARNGYIHLCIHACLCQNCSMCLDMTFLKKKGLRWCQWDPTTHFLLILWAKVNLVPFYGHIFPFDLLCKNYVKNHNVPCVVHMAHYGSRFTTFDGMHWSCAFDTPLAPTSSSNIRVPLWQYLIIIYNTRHLGLSKLNLLSPSAWYGACVVPCMCHTCLFLRSHEALNARRRPSAPTRIICALFSWWHIATW